MSDRIIGIPPDHVVHRDRLFAADTVPRVWSISPDVFKPIWEAGITGKGVRVGVSDTGFASHSHVKNPVSGRNFTSGNAGAVKDENGHGTHVAGTILGIEGIGVAPEAELVVARVLDANGSGATTWINAGLKYCAQEGCEVSSRSLGGSSPDDDDRDAINDAYDLGLGIDVCAAGNSGYSGSGSTIGYPAGYNLGICVGAYQESGLIAGFSSGGSAMDLAAPGQNIISANYRGGFIAMSGTSMATPFVAGLCALIVHKRRMLFLPPLKGHAAWLEFFKTQGFLEDRGTPGFDPRFGNGVLMITKIIGYLADPKWV